MGEVVSACRSGGEFLGLAAPLVPPLGHTGAHLYLQRGLASLLSP